MPDLYHESVLSGRLIQRVGNGKSNGPYYCDDHDDDDYDYHYYYFNKNYYYHYDNIN